MGLFGEDNKGATWFFFIIALVIVGIAASAAFGEEMLSITDTSSNNASDEFQENIVETIFHPSVLGLIFFMLIAIFAMIFLTPAAKNKHNS